MLKVVLKILFISLGGASYAVLQNVFLILEQLTSQPKGEGTTIKYSGGVTNASGERGNFVNRPNMVARYQKFFQAGHEPIHLKTPRDRLLYNGMIYGSLVGLTFSFAYLYKIAKPKKN